MEDLPLKIGKIDHIIIDDAESSDPCRGEVQCGRRAESTCTDQQDPCGFELFLSFSSNFGQDEVPAVTKKFVARQLVFFGDCRLSRPAGDGRNNTDDICFFDWSLSFLKVSDIFIIHVDVDKAADRELFNL